MMKPLGVVRTPFKTRFGTPRQPHLVPSAKATIELFPNGDLNGCLEGLGNFSHLWVLFVFHENTNQQVRGKVRPPRLEGLNIGLFASRSPHRPNPIGLSVVKILSVNQWTIEIAGADFVDGTPILDIKPYVPECDRPEQASGGWTENISPKTIAVSFSDEAIERLQKLVSPTEYQTYYNLIVETLQNDPRPTIYKRDEEQKYRTDHAVYLGPLDVHFRFTENGIVVFQISASRFN